VEITYLGHAGMRVEEDGFRLLMDPWLSRQGAFLGSWFQFPSNHHLDLRRLLDCEWVTVSHEHMDHMDAWVLSQLPASTRVLIPTYPSLRLRQRLARAGVRNVIEVPPWERVRLNDRGDWLTFIPEECPKLHDAGVLVHAGGATLLHCNDARLSVAQVRRAYLEAGGRLDVMAVQMSGANWHPICYDYPEEVIRRISAEKRIGKFKSVARLVGTTSPALAVPFAGPPCFLDSTLAHHNRWIPEPGRFPDQEQATTWLARTLKRQRVQYWMPGDRYQPLSGRLQPDPRWSGFSYSEIDGYLESYAAAHRRDLEQVYAAHPSPDDDFGERFAEHFARLGELSPYFLRRIDMTLRFEVEGPGGGRFDVQLGPRRVRVDLRGRARSVQYEFRVQSRWLDPVIRGEIGWEDLMLSLRFSARREPDIFNDYMLVFFKHADVRALAAIEAYETERNLQKERVVVSSPQGRYEISRYCPHRGQDFSEGGVVEGGTIRCLAHNLRFDLETGTCLNAVRSEPIATRRLDAAEGSNVERHEPVKAGRTGG
jgi:L-ascorbate metabolism protein UlaG (beta-lactamase superfamily)/nitrite reductase/ring-hydroxylating ferredoxin subunit